MKIPRIVAAAIRQTETGCVFTGPHHHIIIRDLVEMGVAERVGMGFEQGFLTSTNEFVNRELAASIALACGQITHLKYQKNQLFSEELWQVRSHWEVPKLNEQR